VTRIWQISFLPRARRRFDKLAQRDRVRILTFLNERVAIAENPRRIGEPLKGSLEGLWRYRVGDFRIVVRIEDDRVMVLVVDVGNRREVYR
jgi:mRNA interferase RelE/StbE